MSLRGILKRVGIAFITVFVSIFLMFFVVRLTPGDVIGKMAQDYAKQYSIEYDTAYKIISDKYNYDPNEPMSKQLERYAKGLAKGSLGTSMMFQNTTVEQIVARALPWTILIVTIGVTLSFIIGTNIGIIMAWKRKSFLNPLIAIYGTIIGAMPQAVISLVMVIIFAFKLGWFPVSAGYDSSTTIGFNLPFIKSALYHACLPIIVFIVLTLHGWCFAMKGNAISVLGEDYISAALIRGIDEKHIMKNYVKKNAMLPLVTTFAMVFASMLGGAVFIETFFSYPGIGTFTMGAAGSRDYTLMQGLAIITSFITIFANLIADLIYAKLDPRVKLEE